MNIVGIQAAEFPDVYPDLKDLFQSFADRSGGQVLAADLVEDVLSRRRQCWVAESGGIMACALTQIVDARVKVVDITHCAGRHRARWQGELVEEIKAWAEHIGAVRVRTINRPGYTRFLRDVGFRETHRIMECEI